MPVLYAPNFQIVNEDVVRGTMGDEKGSEEYVTFGHTSMYFF